MTDEQKAAEQRGYSRGYQAGKKRREREHPAEKPFTEERAFWDRAFLAALPAAMVVTGWKRGDKPIGNLSDRTKLALDFADEALKSRRERRP